MFGTIRQHPTTLPEGQQGECPSSTQQEMGKQQNSNHHNS